MSKLSINHLPVAGLKPYAGNARTHSAKQIAEIAASIRAFGFNNPVLVDKDGGIVAGHSLLSSRVLHARRESAAPEKPGRGGQSAWPRDRADAPARAPLRGAEAGLHPRRQQASCDDREVRPVVAATSEADFAI
jgi:hypothetical protein